MTSTWANHDQPLQGGPNPCTKDVRAQVRGLISSILYAEDTPVERRRQVRYPYPHPIYLHNVDENGLAVGEPIVAAGKDLSESGLGFFHSEPLPNRRMIVSLQVGEGKWLAFLIETGRSQAIRKGWYESGGRFIQPSPSPMESV
jgi:hypothetical protein